MTRNAYLAELRRLASNPQSVQLEARSQIKATRDLIEDSRRLIDESKRILERQRVLTARAAEQ